MSRGPLGLNLDGSLNPGCVVSVAAPWVVLRTGGQPALDRIAVDVLDHFGAGIFAADVAVEVAVLPEALARAFEPARGYLFEGLEELREQDVRRLVDEEMDVLGHQNVGVDAGLVALPGLLKDGLDGLLRLGIGEERQRW